MLLRLSPVVLALWVLAAHFFRAGLLSVALLLILAPALLLIRRPAVARAMQVLLVLGAAEWLWTAASLLGHRLAEGRPWMRMVIIVAAVALLTAASALTFRLERVRIRYGLKASKPHLPAQPGPSD